MKTKILKVANGELDDLPKGVKGRLLGVLEEIAAGKELPKQKAKVTSEIWEARLNLSGQQFRLLYAVVSVSDEKSNAPKKIDGDPSGKVAIALGVLAFHKKTRKTPKKDIKLAEKRLSDWLSAELSQKR